MKDIAAASQRTLQDLLDAQNTAAASRLAALLLLWEAALTALIIWKVPCALSCGRGALPHSLHSARTIAAAASAPTTAAAACASTLHRVTCKHSCAQCSAVAAACLAWPAPRACAFHHEAMGHLIAAD